MEIRYVDACQYPMDRDTLISQLHLTPRARTALRALGIKTVGGLLSCDLHDVLCIPGIGDGTQRQLAAIRERIARELECSMEGLQGPLFAQPWDDVLRELSVRTRNGLKALDITTLEAFLNLSREQFLSVPAMGRTSWAEVHRSQQLLNRGSSRSETLTLEDFPLYKGLYPRPASVPVSFYPETLLASLALPSRCCSTLEALHLTTLASVLLTLPKHLLSQKNFGERSLEYLRRGIRDYLDCRNTWDGVVDTGASLREFLHTLCTMSGQSRLAEAVFLDRVELSATYDTIARKHGRSKERIRQILNSITKGIEQHFQSRAGADQLRAEITDIFDQFSGPISKDELSEELARRMGWNKPVSAECMCMLLSIFLPEKE